MAVIGLSLSLSLATDSLGLLKTAQLFLPRLKTKKAENNIQLTPSQFGPIAILTDSWASYALEGNKKSDSRSSTQCNVTEGSGCPCLTNSFSNVQNVARWLSRPTESNRIALAPSYASASPLATEYDLMVLLATQIRHRASEGCQIYFLHLFI